MKKYLHNNAKLLAIAGIMASVLVFSPVLSAIALAEGTEVAEASATTEATASMNCLPFLGHKKWEAFYVYGL